MYLYGTKDLILKLSRNKTNILKWYIDAAHQVHNDMRGHTGEKLTMGQGGVYNSSTKQKINTKSSTESELVGVDDILTQVQWTNNFIKAQGYTTKDTIIH